MLLPIFFLREKDAQNSCVTSLTQVSYDCRIQAGRIKFSTPAQWCLAAHIAQMHSAEIGQGVGTTLSLQLHEKNKAREAFCEWKQQVRYD